MIRQDWSRYGWQLALSAIALAGIVSIPKSPAEAAPKVAQDLKLAQVGITSQINAPIPLNLRPRTHIPLPTNSRSSDYERYSRYNSGSWNYDPNGYYHDHEHYHNYNRGNHRGGTVIIINPPSNSRYKSYNNRDGYIRIIRSN